MKDLVIVPDIGLFVHDRNGWASSLMVSKEFGKEHKNVLRDIEKLSADLLKIEPISEMGAPRFIPITYPDEYGRKQPMTLMNRDAFAVLTFGFTGKKALQNKLRFIGKFNQMETYIKDQSAAPLEYRPMTDAIQAAHDPAKFYHYSVENDMLYRIVLGVSSKQFREQTGLVEGISPKAYMTPAQINLFTRLQRSNTDLIQMGLEHNRRKEMLGELAEKIKAPLLKATQVGA